MPLPILSSCCSVLSPYSWYAIVISGTSEDLRSAHNILQSPSEGFWNPCIISGTQPFIDTIPQFSLLFFVIVGVCFVSHSLCFLLSYWNSAVSANPRVLEEPLYFSLCSLVFSERVGVPHSVWVGSTLVDSGRSIFIEDVTGASSHLVDEWHQSHHFGIFKVWHFIVLFQDSAVSHKRTDLQYPFLWEGKSET